MKNILFTLLLWFSISSVFSQTITPSQSTEQCPGVNITFTVTIAAQSINAVQGGLGGAIVVQPHFNITASGGNITFSFVGKFADRNQNQVFNVTYINSGGLLKTEPFTFTKIKSLYLADGASTIQPYPLSITAPLCQTQNFNIQFTNVKYGNSSSGPPISYGTITDYEYQLPAGWQLGATTSNGSNWITGGNNVTVTSDLGTGNGQYINIRPVNTACGTGLAAGLIRKILISRPAPSFEINGPSSFCTTANYSISNLPVGAYVTWSVTGTYSISGSNTANPVTVQRSSNGYGTLTATITTASCGVYTVPKNLSPLDITFEGSSNGACGGTATVEGATGTFTWTATGDLLINGTSTTLTTTSNQISFTGTEGSIAVVGGDCLINLSEYFAGFKPEIHFAVNPAYGSDPLSASVHPYNYRYTNIRWYLNGSWADSGSEHYFNSSPPCGNTEVSVEIDLECGVTVTGTATFERYCSWWRSMVIYPNPASSYINIQPDTEKLKTLSATEKSAMKEYEASLYDISGKLLLKGRSNGYKLNLDTRHLKSDNYFIHIKIDGEKEIIKKQVMIRN